MQKHPQKSKTKEASLIIKNKLQFQQALSELRATLNSIDQNFLMKLSQTIELKNPIFSEEISSIVVVISLAAIKTKKPQIIEKQEIDGHNILRIEELSQILTQEKDEICLKMVEAEMVGWTSKIWDRLVHSSCFRNFIDLLVLYFFIGDSLLQYQKQLKRLTKLLLLSFSKIKMISADTLNLTIFILTHFIQRCIAKKYSFDLKIRLKILKILYLSKLENPKEHQQKLILDALKEFKQEYLQPLTNFLSKNEQSSYTKEQDLIWDSLFMTVLRTFHRKKIFQPLAFKLLVEMLNFRIDMQTVKLMIRELDVNDENDPLQKWTNMFSMLYTSLEIYDKPRNVVMFTTGKSYIRMPLKAGKNFMLEIQLKNDWKIYDEQKFLVMIQDKVRKEQLWITTINQKQGQLKLILLKVLNKNIIEPTQQIIPWNQNRISKLNIYFNSTEIKVQANDMKQKSVSIKRFITDPAYLVVGDYDGTLGNSVKSFCSLSYIINGRQDEGFISCPVDFGNKELEYKGVRRKAQPSYIQIFHALGDLDIFLLIVSHAFKRMKTNPDLTNMIRFSLKLMEGFVNFKKVDNKILKKSERQERLDAILCLCWQCSHQTKNCLSVLELLRILSIRGIPNRQDELQVLCNFVFWKTFDWQYQKIMALKIKELFVEYRYEQNYLKHIHKYSKRLLMEIVLYYREQDCLNSYQQKQNLLKMHYQFFCLISEEMAYQIELNKQINLLLDFFEYVVKVLSMTISRKNYQGTEVFDLTISYQLSVMLKNLADLMTSCGNKEKIFKIVKIVLEVCVLYNKEECFYQDRSIIVYEEDQKQIQNKKRSRGQSSFIVHQQNQIKQNLYQFAYRLISRCQNLIYDIAFIDEEGIGDIIKIGWEKKFFNKIFIQNQEDDNFKEHKICNFDKLKFFYDMMPKRCLSFKQNKLLIHLYLTKDLLFPEINQKLSIHLWKTVGINETINIIKKQLFKNSKEESEITQSSKLDGAFCKNLTLFKAKIIYMLATEAQLSGQDGLMIINTMKLLFPSYSSDQMIFLSNSFVLKNLITKLKNMQKNEQTSSAFKSCIEIETKPSSQISQDSANSVTREEYTQCLQFYLSRLTIRNVMEIKKTTNSEQSQNHLQNCKNQLTLIMNYLSCYNLNCNQLKKYDGFLQTQILPLSKYLVNYYCKLNQNEEVKGSPIKMGSFPLIDLEGEARSIYSIFMDERNMTLLKVQKTWHRIEERNKYFWNNFFVKDTVFTLHEGTGMMNQRYILKKKNKKQKLQLPRMHKASIVKSASVFSEKLEFNESESVSSIFDDAHLYRKDPSSCMKDKKDQIGSKEGRTNKFNVLLITPSKIYQGTIVIAKKKLTFTQNEALNEELYSKICVSECQKRTEEECILQNYKFQEELTPNCRAVSKRYLFHDIAIQLHANNRSYLFSFMKKDYRTACLHALGRTIKVTHRAEVEQDIKSLCLQWEFGQISNYEYLMKLNDLCGRSFNDLSQYYVFPWTVANFKDKIDYDFFAKGENFRDLSLPVGKLNKNKWETIKKNYERSKRQQIIGIKPFLYGSFYSNPAIVSNFLIRINPFASQHFQLQSNSFDLADRLFYSIPDSYKSLMQCSSDFKELIPEFYFFPEFLKNRNQYNLGLRQNKDIVNNVILPSWAQDQYEFVFRMRKFLESEQISSGLHDWIDLIFGVYARREYAMRADNLFLDSLYVDSFKVYADEKDKQSILYFKQFGQVPVSIFKANHRKIQYENNFLDLLSHQSNIRQQYYFKENTQCGRFQQILFTKKYTFVLFEKQIRMYIDDKFGDKKYICQNGDFQGGYLKFWKMVDKDNNPHFCLLFHRKKTCELIGFQIRKNLIGNSVFEGGNPIQFKHKTQNITILNNILICSEGKNIYIYRNICEQKQEDYSTKNKRIFRTINKTDYLFVMTCQFTQHKSRIICLKTTETGMLVSIDEQSKIYITQIHGDCVNIYNCFEIRSTCFEEKIVQIIVHNYGFIIIRTDYQRLLAFTFLGDKIIDQILYFKKTNQNEITQKMQCMYLWNKDFVELVVGTNKGNLWKIDLFAIKKCQEIEETQIWIEKLELYKNNSMKERIFKVAVNRIGRHFLTFAYGQNNKVYIQKSLKWDETRKNILSGKKLIK